MRDPDLMFRLVPVIVLIAFAMACCWYPRPRRAGYHTRVWQQTPRQVRIRRAH